MSINAPYPLSAEHVAHFRANGFVRLKHVLSAETIASYGNEITRQTIARNTQTTPLEKRSTYDKAFLQVTNLWEHSAVAREFVFGKRLGRIAAELLEVEGVRLYHDQALYKEPNGGITPAHVDQVYWPLASDRTVTAWIPLQAVSKDMGPLAIFAGSHRVESGREFAISGESEHNITTYMRAHGFSIVDDPFELGEVSFHLGWTFHRAGANTSCQPRSVMTIIYMDQNMRLKMPDNYMQRKDGETFCPGAIPGEVIRTTKNPAIYERAN